MSDRETVDFLATVPLFEGRDEADLMDLARVMRRRTVREGEILLRQGDDARELVFIVSGGVAASLRVPGDRAVEIGRAGPGEMVGEIALLDGGAHTMSVRVTETATVLALGRLDFAALLARPHPSAFTLKRRLASLFTTRLRHQLWHLAGSLGDEMTGPPAEDAERAYADLEYCSPPDSKYIHRMATFNEFDPVALLGFPDIGELCPVPAGAHAARRRGAVVGLLPDDQRCSREGAGSRQPAHPPRAGGAGEGVRLREPHRRSPISGHRDHAGAGAPARPAG